MPSANGGNGSSAASTPPTYAEVKSAIGAADSALGMNGQKISNIGAPAASGDATTKSYVDTAVAAAGGATYFDPVQLYGTLADSYGLSPGDFLGDYTTGSKWVGFKELTVGGIRGLRYTQDCTYTAKLWIAGVAVATKAAAITAGTPFNILFDAPYVVPVGKGFIISVYDGGTRYSYTATAPTWETDPDTGTAGLIEVASGLHLIQHLYAGGDNVPATRSAHRVPLRPILV